MLHEFSRSALLLGEKGLEKLQQSRVIVFGVGGVGSFVAEALAARICNRAYSGRPPRSPDLQLDS